MTDSRYAFTLPSNKVLRWLTQPGPGIPADVSTALLGELFASPSAVIAAMVRGLVLNVVALALHGGTIFGVFITLDLLLVCLRVAVVRQAVREAASGRPTRTDTYLFTAASWCLLQGLAAFTAMRSGIVPLQLLSTASIMGLIGPICARNYAAPRYALLLVALCELPFVAGAVSSGDPWLLVLAVQTPFFLFGVSKIVSRFHAMAVATLRAEQESSDRARHDVLTGLLNRFGLMERLDGQYALPPYRFILFYLDLDGFKPINDNFGHQAGDRMLAMVADRLRMAIRKDDIVSRLGGDEFVIVASDMEAADGEAYANAIIRAVADEPYILDGIGKLRIGISVGFACAPDDGEAGDDLHREADTALYEAKAAGKGVHRRFNCAQAEDRTFPDRTSATRTLLLQ